MYSSSAEFPVAGPLFGRDNCRGLADKSFDKRKAAAQALQQLIKQMVAETAAADPSPESDSEETEAATTSTAAGAGEAVERKESDGRLSSSCSQNGSTRRRQHEQQQINAAVEKAVAALTADFLTSPIPNIRKGGLLGVAAVGLAFEGEGIEFCLPLLLRPLLKSFNDPDPRVRYYACESLFNVLKVVKGQCLPFLSELFDGLCKLCSDVDKEVRQGFGFVDALLKEETASAAATAAAWAATTGSPAVSPITPSFVELLAERLLVRNPYIKLLTLKIVSAAADDAGIDVLPYLPLFLEGLLQLLGDSHRDIRQAADLCVTHFLENLRSDPVETDPAVVAQIAEIVLRCSDGRNSSFTQLTSLVWLHELLLLLLPDEEKQQQPQHQQQRQKQGVKRVELAENEVIAPDVAEWHQNVQKHLKPLAWRMLQSILRCSSEGEDEIARMGTEVHAHVIARVMVSTAALDLSGFVKSAVRYLRTYTPPELAAPTSVTTAAVAGSSAAGGADVRFLCMQWMELMLVEKPYLLLQHVEQQQQHQQHQQRKRQQQQEQQQEQQQGDSQQAERQQKEGSKDEELGQVEQQLEEAPEEERQLSQQQEEQFDDLLLEQQKPLVSAVLYTALTAAGPAASAEVAASQDGSASTPRSAQEQPSRQQSTTTPRGRAAAAASAAAVASENQILRKALSLLTRFTRLSKAKLHLVAEELLLLFSANRRFLDSRGHFVLRQICTMGDPCEIYVHFGVQIERHYAAATATKEAEASSMPISTYSPLRTIRPLAGASGGGRPKQASLAGGALEDKFVSQGGGIAGGSLGQTLQFLHQVVQALSVTLLSAKVRRYNTQYRYFFVALVRAHNCVALVALSLFAKEFQIAEELVVMLSKEDSLQTADLLQLEQLALLFETQVFAFIRVRLLLQPPDQNLTTAIKGVAMLLPQGPAFAMLNQRLQLASGYSCSTCSAR
ncbi:hypothetical protein Esti_005525 [Eimeria stiedai]